MGFCQKADADVFLQNTCTLFYSGVKKFSESVMSSKYVCLDLTSLKRIKFISCGNCSMNQDSINQDFHCVAGKHFSQRFIYTVS